MPFPHVSYHLQTKSSSLLLYAGADDLASPAGQQLRLQNLLLNPESALLRWNFFPHASEKNRFYLILGETNLALTLGAPFSRGRTDRLVGISNFDYRREQEFTVEPSADGYKIFPSHWTGDQLCLSVSGDARDRAELLLSPFTGGNHQRWKLRTATFQQQYFFELSGIEVITAADGAGSNCEQLYGKVTLRALKNTGGISPEIKWTHDVFDVKESEAKNYLEGIVSSRPEAVYRFTENNATLARPSFVLLAMVRLMENDRRHDDELFADLDWKIDYGLNKPFFRIIRDAGTAIKVHWKVSRDYGGI